MPVKFKIGFTIPAETLFGLLAKVLPIEDLQVEELLVTEKTVQPQIAPAPRLQAVSKPKKKSKRQSRGIALNHGINALILNYLADDKPHRAAELQPVLSAAGFSGNSVGSRLQALRAAGVIFQPELGLWQRTRSAQSA
jgi:hypothetical protein